MPIDPAKIASRIQPSPGEDQPAFSIRFHETMKRMIPDTRSRNQMMLGAWGDHDGMAGEAEQEFPAEKYQRATGCEFKEHVARNGDGSQSVYTRDELAAMARNMNRRIRDTGNYGTITDGHTPERSTDPQPPVLGHRGPYYLGQIGQETPRWAIFSTEHANADNATTLKARPTRSAEVWRAPRIEDRIIEPLAALGAEAPRLDLGTVRYARTESGQDVERYMASAMPGPMSTHITGGRDKYAEAEPEPNMMDDTRGGLSPEDIQAISNTVVSAMEDTPQWQFVTSLMQSGDAPEEAPEDAGGAIPDDGGAPPEITDSPDDALDDAGALTEPPAASGAPPSLPPSPEAAPTPEPGPPPATEAFDPPGPEAAPAPEPVPEPVAENDSDIAALKREIETLKAQVSALSADSAPTEQYRRQRFLDLRENGFSVDIDREMELVGDFTEDQFERYAARCEQTHLRVPLADTVGPTPVGELPTDEPPTDGTDPRMERYCLAAKGYVIERRNAGEKVEWGEALRMAQDDNDSRITV